MKAIRIVFGCRATGTGGPRKPYSLVTSPIGVVLFGTLILITSYVKAVSGITKFQSWQLIVRYGGHGVAHGDPEHFKIATGFAFALDMMSGIAGMLIGALIMALMQVNSLPPAVLLLVLIGFCGGFYVVPLNALLQTRGHESVGTGHAIAVQNFFENTMMLLLVGLYALLIGAGIDIVSVASLIGGLVLLSVTAIGILRWRHTPLHRV